jgi:plastocyanin
MRIYTLKGLVFSALLNVGILAASSRAVIHDNDVLDSDFSPLNSVVTQGDTVRWHYEGFLPHTTTSDPSSPKTWSSGTMSGANPTFQLIIALTDPIGNYPYRRTFHALSGMRDTLRVVAAPDTDSDGVPDVIDNCPSISNANQADFNSDSQGDVCDDTDADGVVDAFDNCKTVANPAQTDTDLDGLGDACDIASCCVKEGDTNHNGSVNVVDITFLVARLFQGGSVGVCP